MIEISVYLPDKVITNEDLKSEFPSWDYERIQDKVGIRKRHVADDSDTALDLAFRASEQIVSKTSGGIDFIILCTQSPDYYLPTTACLLQEKLGLPDTVGSLDINLGCSGYIYGLALAKGLLATGISRNLLFVTSETYTKHIYIKDIANRAIFGDAAAATLISKHDIDKIGEFTLGSDGRGRDNLIVRNGGLKNPFLLNAPEIEYGSGNFYTSNNLYMNGPEIYNFTIDKVPPLVLKNLEVNELSLNDIDYFIFHQANQFMLDYLRRKIGIPQDKFCIDLADYGNTVSCTIPIALQNALKNGVIKQGYKVMLVGFGVGYSWGAVIVEI